MKIKFVFIGFLVSVFCVNAEGKMLKEDVLAIQLMLKDMGHHKGDVDGLWGQQTKKSIDAYLYHKNRKKFHKKLDTAKLKEDIKKNYAHHYHTYCTKPDRSMSDEQVFLKDGFEKVFCKTEVFFAGDIKKNVRAEVLNNIRHAESYYGYSGPIEYWVMGVNKEEAEKLKTHYCLRREVIDGMRFGSCMKKQNKKYGLGYYFSVGQHALNNRKTTLEAAHIGGYQHGRHEIFSSMPMAFDQMHSASAYHQQAIIFHELFHAYQHGHMQTLKHDDRYVVENKIATLAGPAWFIEGGAEYMARKAQHQMITDGKIKRWHKKTSPLEQYKKVMRYKFKQAKKQQRYNKCIAGMENAVYNEPCRRFWYDGGTWAIAWLMANSTHGQRSLEVFYDVLNEQGWHSAFQEAFEISPNDFYIKFANFLKTSEYNAMKIIA